MCTATSRGAIYVMSGFSMVLIAILLIAVVKDEIMGDWQAQLPDDIPNYFFVNIRSDDVAGLDRYLREQDIESSPPYALVRARLAQINAVNVDQIDFADPRASHSVTHTYNMTFTEQVPDDNVIVEGKWLTENDSAAQVSVEKGMADRLELEIGDVLTMTVGSQRFEATVTSIRSVVWENFKPNFYLIANREVELP